MSQELFQKLETQYSLPKGLLDAVWAQESARGKRMLSPVGAQGHFQFMPATAKQYGLDDPNDLTKSATAAAQYFGRLSKMFNGDIPKMLAGYNWGEGNVQKRGLEKAPSETRNYIASIAPKVNTQTDILSQVKTAKAAGYSDDEIFKHLQESKSDKIAKAKEAGYTDAEIAQHLGLKVTAPAAPTERGDLSKMILGQKVEGQREWTRDFATGIKKSVLDTVQGLSQVSGEIGSAIANAHPLLKKFDKMGENLGVFSIPSSEQALNTTNAEINKRRVEEAPAMNTFAGNAGNVLGSVVQMVGPAAFSKSGSLIRNMLLTPKNAMQAATGGAAYMGVQATGEGESRAKNAALGAAGGVAGYGISKGLGALANGSSKVTPEIRDLANAAKDKWGIDITAPQIVNNRMLNTAQSVVKDVPFSGAGKFVEKQQVQLNRAVAKTMGESSDNVLTAIDKAEQRLGGQFESVLTNNKVKVDDGFLTGLARVEQDAGTELTKAQAEVINNNIKNILDKTAGKGEIDGQAAYNIKKMLDRLSQSSDTSLAHYGRELRGELMEALNRSLGPEQAAAFKAVREQYKNMLTASKVVSKDGAGNVPMGGARLVDAAKKVGATDLEELGRISNQFLREKTPDSGTARRLVGASLLAGTAGPNALLAVPAARVANSAMTSQTAKNLLLNGSPLLKGAANKANLLLRPAAVESSSRISAP